MVASISVIGLGKLGSPVAASFAARGFRVIGVDLNKQKIDAINRGVPPVHEPGLKELMRESEGHLSATQNAETAVMDSEATFIVVDTPSEPGGGFSLRYVLATVEAIGKALHMKAGFHLVVLTSTVMPGSTGGKVRASLEHISGKICGEDFGLCYSPEFVALGSVIHDFYFPDFLLIGESHPRAGEMLADIYRRTCKNTPFVARMNFINAEITKLAVNTYITTKISYANMIARLCEKLPEADADVVTSALGLDTRIGPKYLKGAVSYGGPCFPRDNRALPVLQRRRTSSIALKSSRLPES
jgi:UDPglucose 6-dehydrogenase